jgi:hypothetical protein
MLFWIYWSLVLGLCLLLLRALLSGRDWRLQGTAALVLVPLLLRVLLIK